MNAPPTPELLLAEAARLRPLARALVRDAAAAEDLVQEAWVAWLRRRGAVADPAAWFAGTLRHLARQSRRGAGRRREHEGRVPPPTPEPSTDELVQRAELQRELLQAVTSLDEPYRSTLLLRFLEELPPRAIARREGVSVATVNTRLARGLRLLRERLDRRPGGREGWLPGLAAWAWPANSIPLLPLVLPMATTPKVLVPLSALALLFGGWWSLRGEEPTAASQERPAALATLAQPQAPATTPAPSIANSASGERSAVATAVEPAAAIADSATLRVTTRTAHTGELLAGAAVNLATADLAQPAGVEGLRSVSHTTAADGTIVFEVLPGREIEVQVRGGGFARFIGQTSAMVAALAPGEVRELELLVPSGFDRTWYGELVNAADGRPVAGATIELEDSIQWTNSRGLGGHSHQSATSDGEGRFSLPVPSYLPTVARVRAEGFAPRVVGLWLDHDRPGQEQRIELSAAAQLLVHVPDVSPTTTARVRWSSADWLGSQFATLPYAWQPDPQLVREAQEPGLFRFDDLPVGVELELAILEGDRVLTQGPAGLLLRAGEHRQLELSAGQRGAIEGTVREADGAPAGEIEVWLLPADYLGPKLLSSRDRAAVHARATADGQGAFRFEGLAPGSYWVGPAPAANDRLFRSQALDGHAPAAVAVSLEANATQRIELVLECGLTLSGTVLDAQGQPRNGAQVVAASRTHGFAGHAFALQEGQFVLGSLASGEYSLTAFYQGASTEPLLASAGAEGLELRFPPAGAIAGPFEQLPSSVVGRFLMFTPTGSAADPSVRVPREKLRYLQYGSEGRFACEGLAPGLYDVCAWAGGEWAASAMAVPVTAGQTTELPLSFARGAQLVVSYTGPAEAVRLEVAAQGTLLRVDHAAPGSPWRIPVPAQALELRCFALDGTPLAERDLSPAPGETLELELP
jgi:RNA polymerase sigma factor (sigma-70 family)